MIHWQDHQHHFLATALIETVSALQCHLIGLHYELIYFDKHWPALTHTHSALPLLRNCIWKTTKWKPFFVLNSWSTISIEAPRPLWSLWFKIWGSSMFGHCSQFVDGNWNRGNNMLSCQPNKNTVICLFKFMFFSLCWDKVDEHLNAFLVWAYIDFLTRSGILCNFETLDSEF